MDEVHLTRPEAWDLIMSMLYAVDVLDARDEIRAAGELRDWAMWLMDRYFDGRSAND